MYSHYRVHFLTYLQMWTEIPKGKNKKPVNKDRFISKMFLRCAPSTCCSEVPSVILMSSSYSQGRLCHFE